MTVTATTDAMSQEHIWEILRAQPDYEICVEYPNQIMHRATQKVVGEYINDKTYLGTTQSRQKKKKNIG